MRSLIALLLLTLGGIASANNLPSGVSVFHDDERGVTCWSAWNALSCLPDSSLLQQASPSNQAGRASKTDFMCEGSALQAAPLLQGFQL